MKEEILTTKLHIPYRRPGMVNRPRLKAQFDSGMGTRLLLICAPAGFGKTSLLSECLADCQGLIAWISLDKRDNDPARFLRYFISSIQSVIPGATSTAESLLNLLQAGAPEIEPLLTLQLNALSNFTRPVIIVLDDYHLIENKDVHNAVSFFIDNAPSQVHIVISTRSDPPLPIARWRARGQMKEIRGDDLRFSFDETETFFKSVIEDNLSAQDIAILDEKTEGWAAGLQMAALSMSGRKDLSDFIRTFSGSHRYIMDYLVEEVLDRQTEVNQVFLLQTSILERLSGDLCDAVTGQTGGQQRLETLEKANMFILPLDDDRRWYRYHHLFADLLQARLRESQPGMITTLHLRAAQWYKDTDMITESITHALAAHDFERSANLVEEAAVQLITRGELRTLLNWAEQLPKEAIYARPRLCVDLAWLLVFAGKIQDVELLLSKAEIKIQQIGLSDETRDILGNIAAQRAFSAEMRGDTVCAIEQAQKANRLLAETNLMMRSTVSFVLAKAYRLEGDLDKAIGYLNEVGGLALASGNIMTLSSINYDLAAALKIKGKLKQAFNIYQDTLRIAGEKGARHFGSIAKIDAGMSDVLLEWNDIKTAHRLASDAVERMKSWGNPTDLILAHITLSRIQKTQGDMDSASDTLEKAMQIKRNYAVFQPVKAMAETDMVRLWLAQRDQADISHWLMESHPGESGPLIVRELEKIVLARVFLEQKRIEESLALLVYLEKSAGEGGRQGKLIEILVLQALAYKAGNEDSHALEALGKALRLAEPEGYMRTFIGEGTPIAEMLFAFRQRLTKYSDVLPVSKDYIDKLLNAFPGAPTSGITGLVEDLSVRELEILRLMASGMTNKQIAAELFITAGTVKAHTANIFRKLNAENRTQAIALARDLKLL